MARTKRQEMNRTATAIGRAVLVAGDSPRRLTPDVLQGGVIVYVQPGDARADQPAVLVIAKGGTTYHVEAWRDEEGNGPGHLFIDEATR